MFTIRYNIQLDDYESAREIKKKTTRDSNRVPSFLRFPKQVEPISRISNFMIIGDKRFRESLETRK